MNRLWLMRHGEAAWVSPDPARPLTDRGRLACLDVIQRRSADLEGVGRVLVSPYRRAQETAALVRGGRPELALETVDWLTPDVAPEVVIDHLAAEYASSSVLLVAHNPLLTRLLNLLVGAAPGRYQLGTSALAAIEFEVLAAGCCELKWLEPGR